MHKVLVIHGAGMDQRGRVDVAVFGTATMEDYNTQIQHSAQALGLAVDIFYSPDWHEVAARLAGCRSDGVAGVIINPAGFTRGHAALGQALQDCGLPAVEVHVSNPARRAIVSEVAPCVASVVAGFGLYGYHLGLQGLRTLLDAAAGLTPQE